MAGDWIKIRTDLLRDPAVLRISKITNIDKWSVVGRLSDIWCWIGEHTTTGHEVFIDSDMIDEHACCSGFAAAMRTVRWLEGRDGALTFPHWERHNSQSAKARALEAEAKRLRRSGDESGSSPDISPKELSDSCPTKRAQDVRPEKRREEKSTTPDGVVPPSPQEGWDEFDLFWEAYPKKVSKQDAKKAWKQIRKERPKLDVLLAALAKQCASCEWTKDNGRYIVLPAKWLRQGKWDDEVTTAPALDSFGWE